MNDGKRFCSEQNLGRENDFSIVPSDYLTGWRTTMQERLPSTERIFYVYMHINENPSFGETGTRYFGKGKGKRAFCFHRRNPHWNNIFTKDNRPTVVLIAENLTEEEAFEIECWQIAIARKYGIKLCNLTDGGEGISNPSPETREKLSIAHKNLSQEARENMSIAAKNISPEIRKQMAKHFVGKKQSVEHIEKRRKANTGKKRTPETCSKISTANKNPSEETRRKQRDAANNMTPEHKKRISEGLLRSWKKRKSLI